MTASSLSPVSAAIGPFGEADCETELQALGLTAYRQYYFTHTRFSHEALNRHVYLIVGRRGAGKTALAQYFTFPDTLPHATAIDVDEPAAFQQIMNRVAMYAGQSREVAIPRLARIWEYIIWSILFRHLQDRDARIRAACIFSEEQGKPAHFIRGVAKTLITKYLQTDNTLADELEAMIGDETVQAARAAVVESARAAPVILAFDTLENYTLRDEAMLRAMAALIEAAARFNREYSTANLHVKLFVMAEIFPYLKEDAISNTLKYVRDEVYLHWRPKDLLRLIGWRLWHHLQSLGQPMGHADAVDWDDHHDVQRRVWEPHFGAELINGAGLRERTFPYVLRHTQMRPRQLIVLCNAIAQQARHAGRFPRFAPEDIVAGVRMGEERLADEVFNSYNSVYPNASRIADALSGLPMVFEGRELDRRARYTASEWSSAEYSLYAFRQMMAELGLVGRVRRVSDQAGIAEADFEYFMDGRLPLLPNDRCAIHPMFYKRLNIQTGRRLRVYPFPNHADFQDLGYSTTPG